jgi:hypothetical protein
MMCSRASGTLETQLLLAARDQKRTKKQNQDQHAMVLRDKFRSVYLPIGQYVQLDPASEYVPG